MVEVEDTSHQEEREIMEGPAKEEPTSTGEKVVDVTWTKKKIIIC